MRILIGQFCVCMDDIQANMHDTQHDHMIRVECLLVLFVLFKLMTNYVSVEGTHTQRLIFCII
jgi:hypothetical protein